MAFLACEETNSFYLQANVMLEYSLADAQALLSKNTETAKNNLKTVDTDLDFLRFGDPRLYFVLFINSYQCNVHNFQRSTYYYGSKHGARIQLGCEAT